jgi:hypothetical protein
MNDRDMLDCLVFGLSRGFVPAQRSSRPRLEEQFPQVIEAVVPPAKTCSVISRLWQSLRKPSQNMRVATHRRLQHCG